MILKPCTSAGCKALVARGCRCPKHEREHRDRSAPAQAASKVRNTHRWKTVRELFRTEHPICCDPLGHHVDGPEPAQDVHHIIPLVEAPHRAFDWDNLAALCSRCHQDIEQLERAGKPTRHLFHGTKPATN